MEYPSCPGPDDFTRQTATWLHHVGCCSTYDESSSWDDDDVLIAIGVDTKIACATLLVRLFHDTFPAWVLTRDGGAAVHQS